MDKIEINNSYDAAVKSGKWGNPGASFYDKIKHSKVLLNEAYLEVGDVDKDTSFSASECKFPHHCIVNGELVVSIPGIKAAYSRAKQMGKFSGEIKRHLEKHYKAMGIYKDSNMYKESVMEDRFQSIYNVLGINLDEFMKEEVIQESVAKEYDIFEDYFIPQAITTPEKLLEFMNGIEYDDDDKHWKLRDPYKDNHKYGNCHDQSLLENVWFNHFGYECGQLFFIEYREGEDKGGRTHTLTWFKDNDKYYWFENAWHDNRGIHGPFESLKELKDFVHSKWEETNNTFPEDEKYNDIEFFDVPNYRVGMDLAQYVDSWTGNYNEQVSWISRFVNDQEFREAVSVIEEKSHGGLKFSFRMGINKENGHLIKVVFDLKKDDIVRFGSHDDTNHIPRDKWPELKKNINKTGHGDFTSLATVKAIIDMDTNEHLQTVKMVGIMNGNQNFARKSLKEREQIMANGGFFAGGNKFTVGEKETFGDWDSWKGTYKTTTPAKSVDHLQKIVNPHLHKESANIIEDSDIEDKWFIKSDDGVDNCCIKVKGYDKPMRGRSSMIVLGFIPSKEAGVNVLGILGKKNSNDYGVPGGGWNKDEYAKDAAIRELHEETLEDVKDVHRMGTLIEYHNDVAKWVKDHVNDENDWWYGYYSAVFVGKYNGKFHGQVDEKDRESGCKWYEVNDIWEKLPKEYRKAISDYLNTYSLPEDIQESVDLLDIEVPMNEASHSNLKYCYRVGFDTDTGEQVAVEFELDPEKVTEPKTDKKDDILTTQMGVSHKIIGSDASLKKIRNKISASTELIKDNIKKKGCIDFVTKDLKVHAIFTRSGRSLDHVHMLPLVNGKVKELIGVLMAKTNFDIKKDFDSQIDKILDSEKFKEGISLLANSSEMYSVSEDYVVGKLGGADKYKSTKLIWKNGLLSSYGFTPILRGFIKDKGSPLLNQDGSRNTNPEKIKKLAKLYIQKNGFVRPKDFKEYVLESVDIIKHKDVNKGGLGVDATKMESHLDCIDENMELYDILSVLYNESLECVNFIWNNPNISWFYCWIPQGFYEKINMVDNLINIIESDSDCIIIDESTDLDLTEINDLFTEADDDKIDVTAAIENNIKSSEDSKEEQQESEEEQQPEETPVEEPQPEEETKEEPIEAPPEIEEPVEEPKEEIKEEPPKEETSEEAPKEPTSLPKQTDKAEVSKNGVNRKKLYIAFIEYCKDINPKNVLSSVFDKDVFHITYPFVPDEMRYFYRLANPTVCILQDNMAFFELSELKKINSENPEFPKKLIFAGTPEMVYIFDTDDKKVYTATEGKDKLTIKEKVGDSFDLFIQDMVGQGDILNAPPEIKEVVADA